MKRVILSFIVLIFSMTILQAEKVKIFDLQNQILQTSGQKVENFKVDDLIVSTNMLLSKDETFYLGHKGNFALTFTEPQNDLLLYLKLDCDLSTWKLLDQYGEKVYIYYKSHYNGFIVNGKKIEAKGLDFKIIIKNGMFTLYANNAKVFNISLDSLDGGIKTISFHGLKDISNFVIYK